MFEISDSDKSAVNNQFIKWIDNKYVKTVDDIKPLISINNYKYLPNYKISLTVKYEQRHFIYDRIKPYSGERIPQKVGTLLGKWDYNLNTNNNMKKSEDCYSIDDSFQKLICPTCLGDSSSDCINCKGKGLVKCEYCNGRGETRCEYCNGKGEVRCNNCNGRGEVDCRSCKGTGKETCYSCNGHGYHNVYVGNVKQQERCKKCHGSGKVNCSSCDGRRKEECSHCSGSGYKDCYKCDNTGVIECNNCKGKGENSCYYCNGQGTIYCKTCAGASNILKYTELKQKFDIINKLGYFFNSEIPEQLKSEIIKDEKFESSTHQIFPYEDEKNNSFIALQDIVIQELLKGLLSEINSKIPKDSKRDKIEFLISICKIYCLNFSYSNENFSLYIYNNNVFFENENVINKIKEDLNLHFYKKLYSERNYVEAYFLIQEICKIKAIKKDADLREFKIQEKYLKKKVLKDKEYKKQLKTQKYLEKKAKKIEKSKVQQRNQTVKIKTKNKNNGRLKFLIISIFVIGIVYYCSVGDMKDSNETGNKTYTSICNCETNDKQRILIETDNYLVHYDSNTCFVLHSNYTHKTYKESKEVGDNLGFREICERNGYTLFVKEDKAQYVIFTPKERYYLIE